MLHSAPPLTLPPKKLMGALSLNTGLRENQPEVNVPLNITGGQLWGPPAQAPDSLPLLCLVWTSKHIKKAPGFICIKYFTSLVS